LTRINFCITFLCSIYFLCGC